MDHFLDGIFVALLLSGFACYFGAKRLDKNPADKIARLILWSFVLLLPLVWMLVIPSLLGYLNWGVAYMCHLFGTLVYVAIGMQKYQHTEFEDPLGTTLLVAIFFVYFWPHTRTITILSIKSKNKQ